MENPNLDSQPQTPLTLSPSYSGRRRSTDPNSPEFEFWMVRNPSFPQPHLLSADQLFNNGVLLPLQLLSNHSETSLVDQPDQPDPPGPNPNTPDPEPGPEPDPTTVSSTSKRWRDIFKMGEKKSEEKDRNRDNKEKKKDRKTGVSSGGAELNINIWPFSRSHSAGTGANRPRIVTGSVNRKVSSAPCSRSNSAGENKTRKWPNSPGRPGIHLGRNSPVWQVKRVPGSSLKVSGTGSGSESLVRNSTEKVVKKETKVKTGGANSSGGAVSNSGGGGKGRGLNLNVPMCIGYRQQLSCRSDESLLGSGGGESGGAAGGGGAGNSGGTGKMFNFRTLFTKKVY